jgi:class 3 adenylate cyclase
MAQRGTPVSNICTECSYANAPTARFCGGCGVRLDEPAATLSPRDTGPVATAAGSSPALGERRLMTVVFADLMGSTQLVEKMDPEDLIDLMAAYQSGVTHAVERHGGSVSAHLGDGMRILFGHPVGQEDAAYAAVRAGLEIVEVVKRLGGEFGLPDGVSLRVRVGVSTGTVVASLKPTAAGLEDNLIGSPLNIAARMQNVAAPDQVVMSESTRRLVATAFDYRDLGSHDLKGLEQPVHVFVVTGEIRGQNRLTRRLRQTRTPMINRAGERDILARRWARASQGHPQFISIFGDAGIGKSRLANALEERLVDQPHLALWMQCKSTLLNTALHPHIDLIERICAIEPEDDAAIRVRKLRTLLRNEGEENDEAVALLAILLSIPPPAQSPPLAMSAQLQKQRTFDVLLRLLISAARRAPVLLVYEDLHWMDLSSRELAAQIASRAGSAALMVVATSRPGSVLPWGEGENVVTIQLGRLKSSESAEIVTSFKSRGILPSNMVERIVAHTDGVPLFVEEMTRMVVDAGGKTEALELPETLRDLLTERLDRLGDAKTIAQIGSVIGREFSVALVASTAGVTPELLAPEFAKLLETGLVVASNDPDVLVFKHALVQDAAYSSLLARHRRDLHARVATGLIADPNGAADASPELVARHLQAAGALMDATQWWLRAGVQAIRRGAAAEAVAHLEAGLEGLGELPLDEARQRAELGLLAVLGPAQMVRNGPGSRQFGEVQRRAFDTMRILPERPAQFPVTYGLALYHWGRAEFEPAGRLARELVATAQSQPTAEHIMAGNNILAMVHFHCGAPLDSRRLLQESVSIYNPAEHDELYPRYMMDFGVFGRFYLALACFATGDATTAQAVIREAMPLALQLHQPHSQGFAMLANFLVACLRRDITQVDAWAEKCIRFSGEQGFPEFVAMATIVRGWAMSRRGDVSQGLHMIERGIALWNMTGFETWQSWFGALRADLLLTVDRKDDALAEIAAQKARIALNGELQFASVLESIDARALELQHADDALVDAAHQRALDIAVAQGAAAWQLQAAVPYAEWLRGRGKPDRAQTIIADAIASLPSGVVPADVMADWPTYP